MGEICFNRIVGICQVRKCKMDEIPDNYKYHCPAGLDYRKDYSTGEQRTKFTQSKIEDMLKGENKI